MNISHLFETDGQWHLQSNEEHSENVARLCAGFASEFGMEDFGKVLGLLHDKGKESDAFQAYIRQARGYDPEARPPKNHNHAYVGGIIANQLYGKGAYNFFVNQIISHHSGLHDTDEISCSIERPLPKGVNADVDKMVLRMPSIKCDNKNFNHLARVLFSCLVDADYLDTERFMDSDRADKRGCAASLADLLPLLESFLANMRKNAPGTELNRLRNKIQQRCNDMSQTDKGFYSLTVPTGGGKTLSSLLWAMKHALRNGQKRIIIAIPYTSIIVQTASILKKIFGEENVLEHHSNFEPDDTEDALADRIKLATENWDYPIIVTTNVQLFESMHSNKPSACRKLHNIVNSVLILDEVQTLPRDFLKPIVNSLKAYNHLFSVSVLFTTASQPVLNDKIEGCNPRISFDGIEQITEIIPKEYALHEKLRRVKLDFIQEGKTYDDMAEALTKHRRVLCIVNTRKDAYEIFTRLPHEGTTLHLSRNMCSEHIMSTIDEIKAALKDNDGSIVRVVATQLVEAGVDIDFPVVYRQETGLDSVLQAAGRCNREGKLDIAVCHVFSLSGENRLPFGKIADANNARLSIVDCDDWFAPETMRRYFKQFYKRCDNFDKKGISKSLDLKTPYFKKAANDFHLIEDTGVDVIVNYGDSMKLVKQLKNTAFPYSLMKSLGKYMVQISEQNLKNLQDSGLAQEIKEGIFVVADEKQYDPNAGLLLDSHWKDEMLII